MFKPWISDEGPKPPEGWGLDAYRGRVPLICSGCVQPLQLGEEYLYHYGPVHATVVHNTEECYESFKR